MIESLQQIEARVAALAARIDAPAAALPTYGRTRDGAHPHIEVHGGAYHYVVVERGIEQEHRRTPALDELLFWIFDDVSSQMAFAHELRHRIAGQDCRRLAFAKKLELMGRLDPAYAERAGREITAVLARHPYRDG
ncbi:Imm63 family immunity protein [Aquabacterium humicola]|uniref:Imm63 family immunity protein n=1 Tax=Aquabacterium humicola TaxID=3237377 RepID=UPI002542BF63|nr:Imm63 family immunity protein [Rubrivivax pictus]